MRWTRSWQRRMVKEEEEEEEEEENCWLWTRKR
jgi:hypothetical protein